MLDKIKVMDEKFKYSDKNYPLQELSGTVIGICMEVHRVLGHGFLEVVYKDAIEYELNLRQIKYEREKKYEINYKGIILPRRYDADFVVDDHIILEVKAQQGIVDDHYKQVINYLAASKKEIGLLVNFGAPSLKFKRLILTNPKINLPE
jgi:GxxExxY protein